VVYYDDEDSMVAKTIVVQHKHTPEFGLHVLPVSHVWPKSCLFIMAVLLRRITTCKLH
jgi:hypothetical protein